MRLFDVRLLSREPDAAILEIQGCVDVQTKLALMPEIVPPHLFRAESINLVEASVDLGYVMVAMNGSDVIGYARVVYTSDPNVLWLHQIAVSPDFQGRGVGYGLMEAVRSHGLDLGVEMLRFTFDPFVGRNAYLYLSRCGAKAIKLFYDFYGTMKSPAHSNRKTHRFLAEWDLSNGHPRPAEEFSGIPVIERFPSPDVSRFGVEIPSNVWDLTAESAGVWQERTYPLMKSAIDIGYHGVYLNRLMTPTQTKTPSKNILVFERPPANI